jgi:hypothetical protein
MKQEKNRKLEQNGKLKGARSCKWIRVTKKKKKNGQSKEGIIACGSRLDARQDGRNEPKKNAQSKLNPKKNIRATPPGICKPLL